MKTRLDVFYLGPVGSIFSCSEKKIEIEASVKVGEILQLASAKQSSLPKRLFSVSLARFVNRL